MVTLKKFIDQGNDPIGKGLVSLDTGEYFGKIEEFLEEKKFSVEERRVRCGDGYIVEWAWNFYEIFDEDKEQNESKK